MRAIGAASLSAWVAHALAWVAGLALAFVPMYQGRSVAASRPGEPGGEGTWFDSTLIAENGLHVVLLLLAPILLTWIPLLAIRFTNRGQTGRRLLLWGPPVVLLGFCLVAMFSIGAFYLPSGIALLVAALADFNGQERNEPV